MVVPTPSDEELRAKIREIVWQVDLDAMGLKSFVKVLSKTFDVDLKPRQEFIKQVLTAALNEDLDEVDAPSSEEEEEEEATSPKKKTSGSLKKAAKGQELSEKLANFLGKGKKMARTAVVSSLWDYIKKHKLQNPENRKEILLDSAMRKVFGCKSFTMFTINKYISAHMHPFTPVDLTTNSTPSKRKSVSSETPKSKRRKGNQPPHRLSNELTAVVGTDVLPRTQVVKKLWEYIKAHDLQDPKDKRQIVCDELLREVFKKPKISMFKMNADLSCHLYERVDRSEYQAESEEEDDE